MSEASQARIDTLLRGNRRSTVRLIDTALICDAPPDSESTPSGEALAALASVLRGGDFGAPLTVRAIGTARHPCFQLVAGERKFAACRYGAISPVPCIVVGSAPEQLASTEELPAPAHYFDEAALLSDLLRSGVSHAALAQALSMELPVLEQKLSLLRYREEERRFLLAVRVSEDSARLLLTLSPEARANCYRALSEGVYGKEADALVASFCTKRHVRPVIKDPRLFYNTIEKAVRIMRDAGVPVEYRREDSAGGTKITIFLPAPFCAT